MTDHPHSPLEQLLKRLATMRKKRMPAYPDFAMDLRQQLLAKANVMNTEPSKKNSVVQRAWASLKERLNNWMTIRQPKVWIPATATALLVIVVATLILPGGFAPSPVSLVDIAEARDYYVLTPEQQDVSGVPVTSGFKLVSKGEIKAKQVEKAFQVKPEVEVNVTQVNEYEVYIDPIESLKPGNIYTFTLAAQELADSPFPKKFQWAYQISKDLQVTGTLPRHQASGVSPDTGIEVNFNYRGVQVEDFQNHFVIEPTTPGTFSVNGKTGIFAPQGGLKSDLYTVTIKQGLHIGGQSLKNDFTFQFEVYDYVGSSTMLNFPALPIDITPQQAPSFELEYWEGGTNWGDMSSEIEAGERTLSVAVYRFPNAKAYGEVLKKRYVDTPVWAYESRRKGNLSVEGLQKVVSIEALKIENVEEDNYFRKKITLPEPLAPGHYVLEVQKNDAVARTLVQVTSNATFIQPSSQETLVWVNDLATAAPLKGATVTSTTTGGEVVDSTSTNEHGLAVLKKTSYENAGGTALIQIAGEKEALYYPLTTIDPFYTSLYWQSLHTDRAVYHSNDTVYFSGFVQGRNENVSGPARALITDYNWFYDRKMGTPEEVLKQQVYDEVSLDLKDGYAFEGKLTLEKMPQGEYIVNLIQGEKLLTSTSISVNDFVKPAYNLSLFAANRVRFLGDKNTLTIKGEFFEGTPVADLPVYYQTDYGRQRTPYTLNQDGEFTFDITHSNEYPCQEDHYNCNLFLTEYHRALPQMEEMADIGGELPITLFRSGVGLSTVEVNTREARLEAHQVDLAKAEKIAIEKNYLWDADYYGDAAPNTRIHMVIQRENQVKEVTGEYYDEVSKVVRQRYQYRTEWLPAGEFNLYTDEKGQVVKPLALDPKESYQVNLTVYDSSGRFYRETRYVGANYYGLQQNSINQDFYLEIDPKEDIQELGAKVTAQIKPRIKKGEDKAAAPNDGSYRYLFYHANRGIRGEQVGNTPEYMIDFTEELAPQMLINAVVFDGKNYQRGAELDRAVLLDKDWRRLSLAIATDKKRYQPGESVTLEIETTRAQNGKPQSADVNVMLVDEAYYAVYSQGLIDPIQRFYGNLDSELGQAYVSQESGKMYMDGGKGGCFAAGTKIRMADGTTKNIEDIAAGDVIETRRSPWDRNRVNGKVLRTYEHRVKGYRWVNRQLKVTPEHVLFINGKWDVAENLKVGDFLMNAEGSPVEVTSIEEKDETVMVYNFEVEQYHTYFADGFYVHNDKGGDGRINFEDTALFQNVTTDENGHGTVTFTLPDNITSWRVTGTAVKGGEDILAGFGNQKIEVSKPVFVEGVVNSEYLTEDKPKIPLRAYGDALKTGDAGTFNFQVETLNYKEEKQGAAFTPTYFELPSLVTGEHKATFGTTFGDHDDKVTLPFEVTPSHFKQRRHIEASLTETIDIKGSRTERTPIQFINHEAGPLYSFLQAAAYVDGHRADQRAAKTTALAWLNAHFNDKLPLESAESMSLYQSISIAQIKGEVPGGISLFPYSDADLELSALLADLNPDLWNRHLPRYFQERLESNDTILSEKILSLYGLAALGEPVLNELKFLLEQAAIQKQTLNVEDKLYTALAYLRLGDQSSAEATFLELSDELTTKDANQDERLKWNTLAAVIASEVGSNARDTLWGYVEKNRHESRDLFLTEQMLYVESRLQSGIKTTTHFTLNGEKITLKGNERYTLQLTPEERENLQFKDIQGEIDVLSDFQEEANPSDISTDSRLSIQREYRVNGQPVTTLKPGQLVEVHFTTNIPVERAGSYRITEYLPSGLQTATKATNNADQYGWRQYRFPYHADRQTLDFYVHCDTKNPNTCGAQTFYYLARVINKGTFIMEPAMLQHYDNEKYAALSGKRGILSIE